MKYLGRVLKEHRDRNEVIGFVPTMGALHRGHLSMVERAVKECDICIVSIFVNPAQFNEQSDLLKYPRTPGTDKRQLQESGCEILFTPSTEEIYPGGTDIDLSIPLDHLVSEMEGKFRPGHFEGVVKVMHMLLSIVTCQYLYMGQKDFQQTCVVRHMINYYDFPVKLIVCPTVREEDGLAMSSRNLLLEEDMRSLAPVINKMLNWCKMEIHRMDIESMRHAVLNEWIDAGLRPEYFEIVDGYTLQEINDPGASVFIVACCAVWAGEVRLIDNIILKDQR